MKDERYYRSIADRFIALRGAPFVISPADISLISSWEAAGIPLDVVLEGIRDAFSLRPGRAHAPGKVRALSFCRPAVERAFERYRERSVGGKRPSAETASARKRKAAWAAVEEFLTRRPPELREVLPYYEAALAYLSAERPDTDALERLDERIEAALVSVAEPSGSEAARVKKLRRVLRIPYVSPFYY